MKHVGRGHVQGAPLLFEEHPHHQPSKSCVSRATCLLATNIDPSAWLLLTPKSRGTYNLSISLDQ
jgi:hypothetical protein